MASKPLYKKIYQDLKKDILTGVYEEEGQIPTELELAESYGVSRITSKRALVELETEDLIYRVRGKGSFVKKREKGICVSTSDNLLFVMPFAQNEGFGNYAEGILETLKDTDYRLHMQPHEWLSSEKSINLKEEYAGIIYYPINTQESIDFLYQCQLQDIPVILLDKTIEKMNYSSVVADNESGGLLSTEHLASTGCEQILFVSGNRLTDVSSVRDRYLGYLSGMYQVNLLPKHLLKEPEEETDDFFNRIYEEIIYQADIKTGLVVENDVLAIRLMTYLKQRELDIGADVAIVGFDNIQATQLMDPPLTTIAQDFYKMGEVAAKLLINNVTIRSQVASEHVVPVKLIVRESTTN